MMKKVAVIALSVVAMMALSFGDDLVQVRVTGVVDNGDNTASVTLSMMNSEAVAGWQLDLLEMGSDGSGTELSTISLTGSPSGGSASANGMTISQNETGRIIGFSLTGSSIPVSSIFEEFFTFDVAYSTAGLSVLLDALEAANDDTRLLFSTPAGTQIGGSDSDGVHFMDVSYTTGAGDFTLGNEIPEETKLNANYPNPFNPTTTISYYLENASTVEIIVYDLAGREVRTLVSEFIPAGQQHVTWDATNNNGVEVSAGTYIYKMVAGGYSKVDKMQYIK